MSALVAPGGAVLAIAADGRGGLWLASEAGLWAGGPGAWRPLAPPPLTRANALLALGDGPALIAGGAPAAIAYSLDAGASWHLARTDEVEAPITCLAASPRFAEDRTLLAGTAGAGILRSTDGGRTWRVSGAGLQEFTVLALAAAPAWGERETALAITDGGLYLSPNGGRFWRRVADCGDDLPLQALALSPAFADDRRAYAAGDLAGLLRSDDGGRGWRLDGAAAPEGVNCLLALGAGGLLAGTAGGAILRSDDGGASWRPLAGGRSSVLALARQGDALVAGLLDEGLLVSRDAGATWAAEAALGLRDLTRLALAPDGAPLAFGPTGGAWRRGGAGWERLAAPDGAPITALLALPDGRTLVATADGLVTLSPTGASVEPAPGGAPATALAAGGGQLWLGDAEGGLWRGAPGGAWQAVTTPGPGGPVLGLAAHGHELFAASAGGRTGEVTIWRSPDGGASWAPWLRDDQPGPARACLAPGEPGWAAVGARVWRRAGGAWAADEPDGRTVVALLRAPAGGLIAATAGGAYARAGDAWERLELEPPPGGLLDMVALPSGRLLGLGPGGALAWGALGRPAP